MATISAAQELKKISLKKEWRSAEFSGGTLKKEGAKKELKKTLDNNSKLSYTEGSLVYEIIYYQTSRGEEVVKEFLHGLDGKVQTKVYARLTLLQEEGPNLKRPYADVVQGKVRELRVQFARNQIRILYFFFHKDQIILLDGFRKKEWAIRPVEIERARQRMEDWMARHP